MTDSPLEDRTVVVTWAARGPGRARHRHTNRPGARTSNGVGAAESGTTKADIVAGAGLTVRFLRKPAAPAPSGGQ